MDGSWRDFLDELSLKVRNLKRIKLVNNTKLTKKIKFYLLYKIIEW